MKNLIIIGAGGFGLELAGYAEDMTQAGKAEFVLKGFLDDTKPPSSTHAGYPVLGKIEPPFNGDDLYIIAVGYPDKRKHLADMVQNGGGRLVSLVHPLSYVAASARIGVGTIIAPFAFVGAEAKIGANCLLNIYSSAGHESTIGDHCVLAPYAGINGDSILGKEVLLGSNAYVTRIKVGNQVRVSAGAVVYSDIPSNSIALGNPASFRAEKKQ